MAISTYTDLKSAVADWLNREDLTSVIPTFVSLVEASLNRTLRVRDMLTRADLTWSGSSGEVVPLPSDFLELYSLEQTYPPDANVNPPLQYVGIDEMKRYKKTLPQSSGGQTRYFTIFGNYLDLVPTPPDSLPLTLTYYASVPALSTSEPTNWLLTKSPDIYLYGSLLHAAPYLKNDERANVWGAGYQAAVANLQADSERAMRPTTALIARKRSFQ